MAHGPGPATPGPPPHPSPVNGPDADVGPNYGPGHRKRDIVCTIPQRTRPGRAVNIWGRIRYGHEDTGPSHGATTISHSLPLLPIEPLGEPGPALYLADILWPGLGKPL